VCCLTGDECCLATKVVQKKSCCAEAGK
jgi:hypothetical protein